MVTALRQITGLNPPAAAAAVRRRGDGWLRIFPAAALALFLAPIGAGLLFTLLPAFGWLPALDSRVSLCATGGKCSPPRAWAPACG